MQHAAVALLLATARAARVATPTKDDRIQAQRRRRGHATHLYGAVPSDRSQETCDHALGALGRHARARSCEEAI